MLRDVLTGVDSTPTERVEAAAALGKLAPRHRQEAVSLLKELSLGRRAAAEARTELVELSLAERRRLAAEAERVVVDETRSWRERGQAAAEHGRTKVREREGSPPLFGRTSAVTITRMCSSPPMGELLAGRTSPADPCGLQPTATTTAPGPADALPDLVFHGFRHSHKTRLIDALPHRLTNALHTLDRGVLLAVAAVAGAVEREEHQGRSAVEDDLRELG